MKARVAGVLIGCFVAAFMWLADRYFTIQMSELEPVIEGVPNFYFQGMMLIGYSFPVFPSFIAGYIAGSKGFMIGAIAGVCGSLVFCILAVIFPFGEYDPLETPVGFGGVVNLFTDYHNYLEMALFMIVFPGICGLGGEALATNKKPNRTGYRQPIG